AFGSVPGTALVYFVAITTLWRCPCINSPRNDSLVPFVYKLAVSTKLPPASRKASYTFRDSSLAAPQPQSSPKVIVPSAASETRSPLLPKSRYRIEISLLKFKQWSVEQPARSIRRPSAGRDAS